MSMCTILRHRYHKDEVDWLSIQRLIISTILYNHCGHSSFFNPRAFGVRNGYAFSNARRSLFLSSEHILFVHISIR
ncbi:hypothetical protein D3C73_1506710 [compost metagenome]